MEHEIKLGVSLYSFSTEFIHEKMDLEEILRHAHRMGYKGIEIVAAQMVPEYPNPSGEWLDWFRGKLEEYELEPVCWSAYIDMGIRSDRDLSEEEITRFTVNDLLYAKRAGFSLVRTQHAISPAIFRAMIPWCKKLGMRLAIEMHHPHHPDVPVWREYLELMKGEGRGILGVVPDFSIFQRMPHRLYLEQALCFGCRADKLNEIVELHRQGSGESALAGRGFTELEEHIAREMFAKFSAPARMEQLKELLDVTFYIHGKFYYLEQDALDPCIPFEKLLPEIRRLGYRGYIASEYEGHHFDETVDSTVQLERFVALCSKILNT